MLILYEPQQLTQATPPELQSYLQQRFLDLCDGDQQGHVLILTPGDTIEHIQSETGYSLATDAEYIHDCGGFYEAVFIISDSDPGVIMIIPKEEGIDPRVLDLCR